MDNTAASDADRGAPTQRHGGALSVVVRRAGLDDYSTIRHVQASAVRSSIGTIIDQEQADVAVRAIYTPDYHARLIAVSLFVAEINGIIAGTCGWTPSAGEDGVASVGALFVAPLFQGSGVARRLVTAIQADAASNGFHTASVQAPLAVVPLFEGLGYSVRTLGVTADVIAGVELDASWLERPLRI